MLKKLINKTKVVTKQLVTAFFFASFISFLFLLFFSRRVNLVFNTINKMAVASFEYEAREKDIKINKIEKRLTEYPSIGEAFGTIIIPSVKIDIPVYHGETLDVLKYGAGHHAGSYFPGEGGTIIIAAHNTYGQFYTLPKVKIGDEVIIKTNYGTYTYKITKTEIANADKLGENLHIYTDKETIMLYTCYPVETPGYKSNRFVAYGDLVGESDE